jgi:hypothetical protein
MEIHPYESVGPLRFGFSRDTVRGVLKSTLRRFRKYESRPKIDVSNELGLHLYYDDLDCLEFIEAFDPANIAFRGVTFLGRGLCAVIEDMRLLGFSPTKSDGYGVTFDSAGIALFAPTGKVEGVAAYRRGYYDHVKAS